MLEIRNLSKHFGPLVAVRDVSFQVDRGEVLGFLGPNGAGKSTTMKMVTGFLNPSAGTAVVAGHDIGEDPVAAKTQIGYLPEGSPAYPEMTVLSFLRFVAEIRGFTGGDRQARVDAAVEKASTLQVSESCLSPQLRPGDLPGTCHHLANGGRLKWVK